jgi:TetR/AcrR family transcriptional regulator, transcriptional repressor for nem operon
MHRRGELAGDPDDLALALLTALQGGLLMTQIHRDVRALEVTLDTVLDRTASLTGVASPT